jgi:hypothetical protein
MPIGKIAAARNLVGTHDAEVEVSTPNHREGVCLVKIRGTWEFSDGDLPRINQIWVHLGSFGTRPHAQHAVLCVQDDMRILAEIIGNQRRLTDAKVDVGAGWDIARNPLREFLRRQGPAV